MEEAIQLWREESEKRAKCNEQWKNHHFLSDYLIDVIKGEVSDDVINCMKYVKTLPLDCGVILAIDSYTKHFEARVLLAEILEVFSRNGDYMTLVKLFVVQMMRNKWW